MKKVSPEIGEICLGKHNIITSYYEQNQAEALSLDERVIDLICKKSQNGHKKKQGHFQEVLAFKMKLFLNMLSNLVEEKRQDQHWHL